MYGFILKISIYNHKKDRYGFKEVSVLFMIYRFDDRLYEGEEEDEYRKIR
jgi:hypothetical protein